MQYDLAIEDVSPIRRRLRFTVDAAVVRGELETAYKSLKNKAKIPGFRPGKAPRNVLEARFGRQVNSDVSSRLIEQAFRKASEGLDLAGQPALEEQGEVVSGAGLSFVIGVDVKPSLSLEGYTGLRVEFPTAEVRDADVDAQVNRTLQSQARIVEVTDDRPVQEGDRVLAALTLRDGDEVVADEPGTMILTSGERFYSGIESLLIGASRGETRTGTVTIGTSSLYEHLAGRTVQAEVTVSSLQALQVPALDDAFAAEQKFEGGVEGMRAAIRMRLQEQADEAGRNQARVSLLQTLVDANEFEVPQALVQEQFNALVEELKVRRAYGGQDPRSIRFSDAEVKDLSNRALFAAKASVILATIARQENLDVSDAELDARVAEIAEMRGQQVQAIRAYLQRENAFGVLKTRILEEKTLAWLLEASDLVPVAPSEGEAAAAEAPAPAAKAPKAAKAAKAAKVEDAPAEAPASVEAPAPAAVAWNKSMKKEELLEAAQQLGIEVNAKATKAQIIEALEKA